MPMGHLLNARHMRQDWVTKGAQRSETTCSESQSTQCTPLRLEPLFSATTLWWWRVCGPMAGKPTIAHLSRV